MKNNNKIFFLIFILVILILPKKVEAVNNNDSTYKFKKTIIGFFVIEKIEKTKNAYIIHAIGEHLFFKKEKCYFTIVSLKSKFKEGKKIKIGQEYKFVLNSFYKEDTFPGDITDHIRIEDKYVHVRSQGFNVYTTPNLKGLYYIPIENDK